MTVLILCSTLESSFLWAANYPNPDKQYRIVSETNDSYLKNSEY